MTKTDTDINGTYKAKDSDEIETIRVLYRKLTRAMREVGRQESNGNELKESAKRATEKLNDLTLLLVQGERRQEQSIEHKTATKALTKANKHLVRYLDNYEE